MEKKLILKVLVGSRAHGLANPKSDYDYRGVYVTPTEEILSLNHKYKGSHWLEGKEDQTSYEIGHFLQLATRCNPTILEVFKAPVYVFNKDGDITTNILGVELRELFPYVWNPKDAFNAFVGYGLNQRKKMLDNKDDRWQKYAVAYLRTLYNLCDLLKTDTFSLEVPEGSFKEDLIKIRNRKWSHGQIVDCAEKFIKKAKSLRDVNNNQTNINKVNDFLLKIRKEFL